MEEENRKGPGVFYAVVGVATLVVAIIGATFAYFSASTSSPAGAIQGETNNITGSDLTLTVTKLYTDKIGTGEGKLAASQNLVPADFDDTTTTGVTAAVSHFCIDAGYTGCHVYDIAISSSQPIAEADLKLALTVTPATGATATNWKYLVYQGTDAAASSFAVPAASLADPVSNVELHSRTAAASLDSTVVHYYLMVYLKDTNKAQNVAGDKATGETNEIGSYTGSVTLSALGGGQVKATFSA